MFMEMYVKPAVSGLVFVIAMLTLPLQWLIAGVAGWGLGSNYFEGDRTKLVIAGGVVAGSVILLPLFRFVFFWMVGANKVEGYGETESSTFKAGIVLFLIGWGIGTYF